MTKTKLPTKWLKQLVECLATGFYLGKIPWAPGTWGTLLGIPVVWVFWLGGPMFYMLGAVTLLFVSIGIAELHEVLSGSHDSGEVVIDEVVGYVITMTWLPHTWLVYLAGFALFRFFDILKPFPIGTLDRKIQGGLGTVLDDVAAGLVSNVILQLIYTQTNWFGVTWNGSSLG